MSTETVPRFFSLAIADRAQIRCRRCFNKILLFEHLIVPLVDVDNFQNELSEYKDQPVQLS